MFHKRAFAVAYVVFMLFGLVCMSLAATLPQARAPMPTDPSTLQKSSLREKLVGKLTTSGQLVGKLTSGQLEAIAPFSSQMCDKNIIDRHLHVLYFSCHVCNSQQNVSDSLAQYYARRHTERNRSKAMDSAGGVNPQILV
ncbi:hypothetical protein GGU11DRAFT_760218 [Lentinula aff. detonsa]|nr:hypothetical protein GGU11DRAFT_760218 [Lentinula aff. detonsa]